MLKQNENKKFKGIAITSTKPNKDLKKHTHSEIPQNLKTSLFKHIYRLILSFP